MSSHYSGSRGSHRQPVVEQVSSARPEAARHSSPNVHRSTRHSRDRDLHLQTSRSPQHRTVEPTHDEGVELAEAGLSWGRRFERSHDLEDLQRAIEARERAFELMPEDHPRRLWLLYSLSLSLAHRFDHLGKLDDLERSLTLQKQAVDRTPETDPNYALRLSALADSLYTRYQHLGELHDLRDSIAKSNAALSLMPEDHPDRPRQLSNLGISLCLLFERLGGINDLEEAIATHRRAVDLTPEGHPDRPRWLDGLANSLGYRFGRLGDIRDLEEAITAGRLSVELTPEDHPELPTRLSNLAVSLESRFQHLGEMNDLENAIATHKRAVNLTPENHPSRPIRLSNLAITLRLRFEHLGRTCDLQEGIEADILAVKITPEHHPERPGSLFNLGISLRNRFRTLQSKAYFDATFDCFMNAAMQPLGNPVIRLKSAQQCVSLLTEYPRFSSAELVLNAHSRIIEIFPEIVWLGHSLERRYQELAKLGPEVNATVSAFIRLHSRYQALEWMETGRTFVWAQMSTLREPLEALERAHPELAEELREVSTALQRQGGSSQLSSQLLGRPGGGAYDAASHFSSTVGHATTGAVNIDSASDQHRGLAIRYDEILKDVRKQQGFEDFLRPAKIKSLLPAIERLDGPVVFINVHSSSCDALALSPDGGVQHIALPKLSEKTAQAMRLHWTEALRTSGLRMRASGPRHLARGGHQSQQDVLRALWTCVVHPILEALGLIVDDPPASHRLPHVTWCPMGPLTQLPLHAAGIYDHPHALSHTYDFVVSSYTPSLAALLRCHKQLGTDRLSHPNILLIAQPATPKLNPLPSTRDECKLIRLVTPKSNRTVLLDRQGTVTNTLNAFDQHPWVHIACHGLQDTKNPVQSQFALYDGPLTLSALMNRVSNSAELAFLSACQTAVGDEKIPEESVHLAAGMLAVGFKGVVATMWSIGDTDAPIVGKAYYKRLLKLRKSRKERIIAPGYTGAAYALHRAVKVLRDEVGELNFVKWAPFVHFGV